MGEQEKYRVMMQKMIDETENSKIQSSKELIQAIVEELTKNKGNANKVKADYK